MSEQEFRLTIRDLIRHLQLLQLLLGYRRASMFSEQVVPCIIGREWKVIFQRYLCGVMPVAPVVPVVPGVPASYLRAGTRRRAAPCILPKARAQSAKLSGPACCKQSKRPGGFSAIPALADPSRPKSQLPISTASQRIKCYSDSQVPCSTQDWHPDASFHACACTLTRNNAGTFSRFLFLALFRLNGTVTVPRQGLLTDHFTGYLVLPPVPFGSASSSLRLAS